jgi:hypothetical protein
LVIRFPDFSAFTYPFSEQPIIAGRTSTGFYIPTPTSIRNYLEYPDVNILNEMVLPYPFRVKEPVAQRLDRLDSKSSFMVMNLQQLSNQQRRKKSNQSNSQKTSSQYQPIKLFKRHSLALGQVDQILKKNKMVKINTLLRSEEQMYKNNNRRESRAASIISDRTQDIITWIPDQNTEWQDWMQDTEAGISPKQAPSISSTLSDTGIPLRLHIPRNNSENQLHPLDNLRK